MHVLPLIYPDLCVRTQRQVRVTRQAGQIKSAIAMWRPDKFQEMNKRLMGIAPDGKAKPLSKAQCLELVGLSVPSTLLHKTLHARAYVNGNNTATVVASLPTLACLHWYPFCSHFRAVWSFLSAICALPWIVPSRLICALLLPMPYDMALASYICRTGAVQYPLRADRRTRRSSASSRSTSSSACGRCTCTTWAPSCGGASRWLPCCT